MNYTSRNLRYMLDVSIVSIEKSLCENLERQQYSQPLSSSGQNGKCQPVLCIFITRSNQAQRAKGGSSNTGLNISKIW